MVPLVTSVAQSRLQRYGTLFALILAGEVIFALPFHIPRFFRPNMLEVFQLSNTQLGDMFAMYGIVALLAYYPGGAIADRFAARSLLTLSLVATALGGFYLYTVPSLNGLYLLFAYWGLTSILLFWAALIKATRDWGGPTTQGLAFGILDGGRGLVASVLATLAVLMLSARLTETGSAQQGMQSVILFYSGVSLAAAAVIWLTLPAKDAAITNLPAARRAHWRIVFAEPSVWLQALIVVCAYCGYKALDNYGVYAVEVLDMSQLEAASLNTYASFSRPLAAIAAGLWVDHWRASKLLVLLFGIAMLAFYALSTELAATFSTTLILANLLVTFFAVYALRGIYFCLMEESQLDKRITGSAVGLISVIGFTPDIFFAAIAGRILDANPGAVGFQNYFLLLALICAVGMGAALILSRRISRQQLAAQPGTAA